MLLYLVYVQSWLLTLPGPEQDEYRQLLEEHFAPAWDLLRGDIGTYGKSPICIEWMSHLLGLILGYSKTPILIPALAVYRHLC